MITLFGLAGSGKSTQGRMLAERKGWKWLSVGQVLRDTGRFDEILKAGELVDDMEVVRLMNEQIEIAEKEGKNVVLDGYPRDITQAEWVAENMPDKIEVAIYLDVPKEVLWERIAERQREDDTKEVVERRFKIVEDNIKRILELLAKNDVKITTIEGTGSVEEVAERIEKVLFEAKVL